MRSLLTFVVAVLFGVMCGALTLIYYDGNIAAAIWSGVIAELCFFTIIFIERRVVQERLRRMSFLRALFLRTAIQLALIVFYFSFGAAIYSWMGSGGRSSSVFPIGDKFWIMLSVPVIILLLLNMIRQMSRMLGQNVLANIIVGKYSEPVEEERIFMFLDLDASTTIAERLGNIRYHNLLDDYVYDITRPILDSHGEIYQYVGDEVVVTWSDSHVNRGAESINCFFRISDTMDQLAPKYQKKYGFVPGFKAGFHCGTVVAGQIGDVKKEIVFQGDVVNTASRIKETCGSLGVKMLISRELLDKLPMENSSYKTLRAGSFLLKGKEREVELYSVAKADSIS
jgi:adenylate cyclase